MRVNFRSDAGRDLGRRFGIDVVPSFVVFDASGEVIARHEGTRGVPVAALRRELRAGAR